MSPVQPQPAHGLGKRWDASAEPAHIDRADSATNSRDRFEAALMSRAEQGRPPLPIEPPPPEAAEADDSSLVNAKTNPVGDDKTRRSPRPVSEECEALPAEPAFDWMGLARTPWWVESDTTDAAPDGVNANPAPCIQSDVLTDATPPARPAVHTPPEHPISPARLLGTDAVLPGQTLWQFEVAGHQWPVSTVVIQRTEGMPLQVGLQNHNPLDTKPSAISLQRLRDRLAMQGVRLTEWEESDTP